METLIPIGIFCILLFGVFMTQVTKKVSRTEFRAHMDMVNLKIDHIKERVDEIWKDTKEVLRLNGKK